MKKFILTLLILLTVGTMFSQKVYYTDFFSVKELVNDTCWTDWSEWRQHFTTIELYTDSVVVYNEDVYKICKHLEDEFDDSGYTFRCVATNKKEETVQIRLWIQFNGIKQLYVDFDNKIWVYNLN